MTGLPGDPVLIHSARKIDADGLVDDFWLTIAGNRIESTGSGGGWRRHAEGHDVIDAHGHSLTPGFIDLHGHGGGGFSFDDGPSELVEALAAHRAHGTTRSVVSLVSNPIELLKDQLAMVADVTELDPLVLGSHLEGPFLSNARRGAHNPAFLCDPAPEMLEELLGAARGTMRQLTIAPELPNALESIGVLIEAGVVVAVGHTAADYDTTRRAFEVGARLLTHTFNGMPDIGHREPGPVIAAFDDEHVTLELVLDGVHVHPRVAHLAFTAAPGRIALITDSMAAAGAPDGDYTLGGRAVTVTAGRVELVGANTIAGSTLFLDQALRNAIALAGVEPTRAVEALTLTPARALGLDHRLGRLKAGFDADALLFDREWNLIRGWANGVPLP